MHKSEIFDIFPVIKTKSFLLRELQSEDVYDFYKYMTNENVQRFLSKEDTPVNLESARSELDYWKNLFTLKRSIYWGIDINNKLIGTCGFNNWSSSHRRCEISYDLSYDFWNKGIMTEAIRTITDFAFSFLDVNRVQATVAEDNIGSIRTLEKNDFENEALLKKYGVLGEKSKNFYMYAKVR